MEFAVDGPFSEIVVHKSAETGGVVLDVENPFVFDEIAEIT